MNNIQLLRIFLVVIIVTTLLALTVIATFIAILIIIFTKIRKRCLGLIKQTRIAIDLIEKNLTPSIDVILAVLVESHISEEKAKEIYFTYDSRRRKIVEKIFKWEHFDIKQFEIFGKFLSDSNFMKSAGFLFHRLLHKNRSETFKGGETVLADAFPIISSPKTISPEVISKSPNLSMLKAKAKAKK